MDEIDIKIKWAGKTYEIRLDHSSKIINLRDELYKQTQVRPERQKLIGLKGSDADALLGSYKTGKPIMMIGSAEKDIEEIQVT